MVACLAAPPAGAFKTYAPDYTQDGVARIVFIPDNTPQAQSAYVVTRMIGNVSQVSWRRFGSVGRDWTGSMARRARGPIGARTA